MYLKVMIESSTVPIQELTVGLSKILIVNDAQKANAVNYCQDNH